MSPPFCWSHIHIGGVAHGCTLHVLSQDAMNKPTGGMWYHFGGSLGISISGKGFASQSHPNRSLKKTNRPLSACKSFWRILVTSPPSFKSTPPKAKGRHLKMDWIRRFLLETIIFRVHDSFRGCRCCFWTNLLNEADYLPASRVSKEFNNDIYKQPQDFVSDKLPLSLWSKMTKTRWWQLKHFLEFSPPKIGEDEPVLNGWFNHQPASLVGFGLGFFCILRFASHGFFGENTCTWMSQEVRING